MPHLRLPAGTDVAEMALFDTDALPPSSPAESAVAALAASNQLVRFPTGSDGGYLLHLYVDESVPADLQRFCLAEDRLSGVFCTSQGNIAFGGLESTCTSFKPNRHIRSDGAIDPGEYSYNAFRTDFPDELIEEAVRVERTSGERWLSRAPVILVLAAMATGVGLAVSQRFLFAGMVWLAGYFGVKWLVRIPTYRALEARRELAQLEFPSIVVEMRSNPSIERTSPGKPAAAGSPHVDVGGPPK